LQRLRHASDVAYVLRLRPALVLAPRAATLRVGFPHQAAALRRDQRVRVHHRQLLLVEGRTAGATTARAPALASTQPSACSRGDHPSSWRCEVAYSFVYFDAAPGAARART